MDLGNCDLSSSSWWRPLTAFLPPHPVWLTLWSMGHTQDDLVVPGGPPHALHLECVSSLAPRKALGFPSVAEGGGCHLAFPSALVAVALWAGSSATC